MKRIRHPRFFFFGRRFSCRTEQTQYVITCSCPQIIRKNERKTKMKKVKEKQRNPSLGLSARCIEMLGWGAVATVRDSPVPTCSHSYSPPLLARPSRSAQSNDATITSIVLTSRTLHTHTSFHTICRRQVNPRLTITSPS